MAAVEYGSSDSDVEDSEVRRAADTVRSTATSRSDVAVKVVNAVLEDVALTDGAL